MHFICNCATGLTAPQAAGSTDDFHILVQPLPTTTQTRVPTSFMSFIQAAVRPALVGHDGRAISAEHACSRRQRPRLAAPFFPSNRSAVQVHAHPMSGLQLLVPSRIRFAGQAPQAHCDVCARRSIRDIQVLADAGDAGGVRAPLSHPRAAGRGSEGVLPSVR